MLTFGYSEIKKKGITMRGCGKIRGYNIVLGLILTVLSIGSISSCSSSVHVEGFDSNLWKQDTSACKNERIHLVDKLLSHKNILIKSKDEHITAYLGKPDNTIYFARGKKTLIYSILPSSKCPLVLRSTTPKSFRIDIDALGRAELVYVLNQ